MSKRECWTGRDARATATRRANLNNTQYYTLDSQILAQKDPTYFGGRVDYLLDALGSVLRSRRRAAQ